MDIMRPRDPLKGGGHEDLKYGYDYKRMQTRLSNNPNGQNGRYIVELIVSYL